MLTSKKVDMIAATMSITEERMKEVDFSTPYFMSGQMILVREAIRSQDRDIAASELYLYRSPWEGRFAD